MRRVSVVIGERPAVRLLLVWFLLFVAGAAWAAATPLGASPDEPAHIIKAASVVRGELLGEPTRAPAVRSVTVPEGLANSSSWPCYAFDGAAEASCITEVSDEWTDTRADTSAGLYNPTFYALVGWPSLLIDDASAAVMGMRFVNALLTAFFLSCAIAAMLAISRSRIVVAGVAASITPMVFFLNGSVNPNGIEIAAGAALLASLLLLVRRDVVRPGPWLVTVAASGVLLAQSRGLSPLWLGLFGITSLIAARPGRLGRLLKEWKVWVALLALLAGVAAAGAWIVSTNTLGSMGVFPGAGEVSPRQAFVEMLLARSLDPGYVGVFGWLDTPAAPLAYVAWSFLACAVVAVAAAVSRRRDLAALAFAGLVFVLVPPVVQAASVSTSGYIWQGRYGLVAYVGVIIVAAVLGADSCPTFSDSAKQMLRRFDIMLIAVVGVAHAFTLLHATKRYSVGTDADWLTFFTQPEWSPPLGAFVWPILVGVAIVGVLVAMRANAAEQAEPGRNAPRSGDSAEPRALRRGPLPGAPREVSDKV